MASLLNKDTPGFAFIEVTSDDPFVLFNKWYDQAKQSDGGLPQSFTLATVSRDGKVGARSLIARRLDPDGFVFTTCKGSRKTQDLAEVPHAAMVFLWSYIVDGQRVIQQVRVEGSVKSISTEERQAQFDLEPLSFKMRSHLCKQGSPVEWQELQDSYVQLLGKIKEGLQLAMPDNFVGYKLTADMMEFYYCGSNKIADRLLFKKGGDGNTWSHQRVAA